MQYSHYLQYSPQIQMRIIIGIKDVFLCNSSIKLFLICSSVAYLLYKSLIKGYLLTIS